MPTKYTAQLVVFLVVSSCLPSNASNLPAADAISVFSNWDVYPATGDCGGQTLTLVRNGQSQLVRGYLQTYEGNCEATKIPITNVQFNGDKGKLSFSAAVHVQDGKGALKIVAEQRFVGVMAKTRVTGQIQYCPIDGNPCSPPETIKLPAVAEGTPE